MNVGELLYFLRNRMTENTLRELHIKTNGQGRISDMQVTSITTEDDGLHIVCCTTEDDREGGSFLLDYISATDEEREAARACIQSHVSV